MRMWRNVVNELENDPQLRGRYQYWVFAYPTGNPPAYSALRFREELEKLHQLHPDATAGQIESAQLIVTLAAEFKLPGRLGRAALPALAGQQHGQAA